MTKAIPPALMELIDDPQAALVEKYVLDIARTFLGEGMPPRFVVRGLAGAICKLIEDNYLGSDENFVWSKNILAELETGFGDWRELVERIDDLALEIVRSRDAGGTGNPYQ